MDSIDLLAREAEYKKLNKQLEQKTVSLMKEIETVMQKQDIFSEFTSHLSLDYESKPKYTHRCNSASSTPQERTPTKTNKKTYKKVNTKPLMTKPKSVDSESDNDSSKSNSNKVQNCDVTPKVFCNCCSVKNVDISLEFLYAFVSVNVQDKVLPQSFLKDGINIESVCKYLVSKIKLMQEQTDKLQSVINRKADQCESHLTQIAEYESERLKLMNTNNSLLASVSENRAKALTLQNKLNEKDRLFKEQRSESDKLSSEVKRLRCRNANVEAKSVGQDQEIEKFRQQIDSLKTADKEFRASSRNLCMSHTTAITKQETQIKHLKQTVNKQNNLINNLRKQLALTSIYNELKIVDKDYNDMLKS